jgi:PAS domain S-box-containing protein
MSSLIASMMMVLLVTLVAYGLWERSRRFAAERALQVRNKALDLVVNAVTITNANGSIEYANRAFYTLTGFSVAEVIGQTPRVLKSGHHDARFYESLWKDLSTGKEWHGEIVNRRKDGHLFVDEMTITPLWGDTGSIEHYVAVRQDLSEQKEQQRRLLEKAEANFLLPLISFVGRVARGRDDFYNGILDLLEHLHEFSGQIRAVVFELQPDSNALHLVLTRGKFSEEFLRGEAVLPLGTCLCGRAAVEGKVLVCENCFHDERHSMRWPGMQLHGHYTIPIKHAGKVLGVLNLYSTAGVHVTSSRLLFLENLGIKIGEALQSFGHEAFISADD